MLPGPAVALELHDNLVQHELMIRAGQNIVLELAEVSGTSWITSQCSTILPSRTRNMSTIAEPRSFASTVECTCSQTRSPSDALRTTRDLESGFFLKKPVKYETNGSLPSGTRG